MNQVVVVSDGRTETGTDNNKIEAKGNRGNALSSAYPMPGSEGMGRCQYSGGTT